MKTEFSGCFGRTKNDFNVIKTREKQKTDKPLSSLSSKTLLVLIIFLFTLTMTACGSNDSKSTSPEVQPKSSVTMKVSQKGSTVECPNGGISIDTGIDDNGNGILDPDEVDETQFVCNGTDGKAGVGEGLTTLISIKDEASGDNCADGGKKIETGVDNDGDGELGSDEVDETHYVCNGQDGADGQDGQDGQDGADGTDGLTTLISIIDEVPGGNCSNGGIKVDVGLDLNRNEEFDTEEIVYTYYVCNGLDGDGDDYSVGGTVSGFAGGDLVLQNTLPNNERENLPITSNASFAFPTKLYNGASYAITVIAQPTGQMCTIANGSGTVFNEDVTDITVTCSVNTYTVGGTISGFLGKVTLQNNGGDDIIIYENGSFTFPSPIADSSPYNVTVSAQPTGQTCMPKNNEGSISGANVTDVAVDCADSLSPAVIFKTPSDGATDADVITTVSATFSEPMDELSVTGSFTLSDGSVDIPGSITFSGDGTIATFIPNNNLNADTTYTATITIGAMDLAGNPLANNETWGFAIINCTTIVDLGLVDGEIWTVDGSPYCVTGDIRVSLLTIEPGVEVLVDGAYEVKVLSTITAIGTEANPILFSAKAPAPPINQRWKGIKFQNTPPGSEFTHTIIEYSNDSGITLTDSNTLIINNSIIRNNTSPQNGGGINALLLTGQTLEIRDSIFENNTANPNYERLNASGGAVYVKGDSQIIGSYFRGNFTHAYTIYTSSGRYARGGAIWTEQGLCEITASSFIDNGCTMTAHYQTPDWSYPFGGAIIQYSGSMILKNSLFAGNTLSSRRRVDYRGSAVYVQSTDLTTIENCTLVYNTNAQAIHIQNGEANLDNSIVFFNYNSGEQIYGSVIATYSDIQGGYDGEGNINLNPAFVGTGYESSDFELAVGSPAIDAGNPDTAYDDVCFPPSHDAVTNDMGAYGGPLACDW